MPAVTTQAMAKAVASSTMVRSIGTFSSCAAFFSAAVILGRGNRKRFRGRPTRMCTAAQARQVSRQPMVEMPQAVSGQPTVLAKPAMRVMPVMGLRAAVP